MTTSGITIKQRPKGHNYTHMTSERIFNAKYNNQQQKPQTKIY